MANEPIDYINRDIVNIKNDIHTLNRLVRDGNGQHSLIQQAAEAQKDIKNVEKEIDNVKQSITGMYRATSEKNALSWHFKTAILVALISSIASIYMNWQLSNSISQVSSSSDIQAIHQLSEKIDKALAEKK